MTNDHKQPDEPQHEGTLPYARPKDRLLSVYEWVVGIACGLIGLMLGISTAAALYEIPGKRSLFPPGADFVFSFGIIGIIAALPLFIASLFTRNKTIILMAAGLVVAAIIWIVRFIMLLCYL